MTYLTSFPGQPPTGPGFSYADHIAGLYASLALLGALEHRRRTGKGQYIDISEVDIMKSLLGGDKEPIGNLSKEAAPHNVYRCQRKNRWCAMAVFSDEEWQGLNKAMGDPPWSQDKKFTTLSGRLKNRDELDRLISAWTKRHTAEDIMARLQANGVAVGVVQDVDELARNPQLKTKGFFIDLPVIGKLVDASPIRLSASPAEYSRSAPTQGRDNDYIYGKLLGLNKKRIAELKKKGVI
jgi:benzylsuccinate CoA-transferase BbsF subunit